MPEIIPPQESHVGQSAQAQPAGGRVLLISFPRSALRVAVCYA